MIREHGFKIVFWSYWLWHISLLYIMINQISFPANLIMSLNEASIGFLSFFTALIFCLKLDDCNIKYLPSNIASIAVRYTMKISVYCGLSDTRLFLLWSGLLMMGFYASVWFLKRDKNNYFKY